MKLSDLINRVRSVTRDFNGSIYREQDVIDFIKEGIDRFRNLPELVNMPYPIAKTDDVIYLPNQYHYLLAIYSASRCFFLDGQSYNAGTMMNEFETKMNELIAKLASGEIIIKDETGTAVVPTYFTDVVSDVYFDASQTDEENLSDYIAFYQ